MRRVMVASLLVLWAAPALATEAIRWNLDKGHTHVGFTAKHLAFAKVRGELRDFDAVLEGDPKTGQLVSVEATAQTRSISTGEKKRDKHLQSDDFFNAAKFPVLRLKSKSFAWSGNNFTAQVELTIRNITKVVTFKGERLGVQKVNFGTGEQLRAAYEASATINRKDFGLKFGGLAEGIAIVGDDVVISLEAEVSHPLEGTSAAK